MASSIFFGGRLISVPGSYSVVDASGLESVGLSAAGIVAVIGEAEGGIPVSEIADIDDFIRCRKPEKAREYFRAGPLREAADMVFAPAKDVAIPGGAVEMVAMKVNPATQATAPLANTYGDALTLTSKDYGAFTSQVNVTIETGTSQGKLVTITFEDVVESADDLGGDAFFTITYTKGTGGWGTMTSEVASGGLIACRGTRTNLGLDDQIAGQLSGNSRVEAKSSSASDTAIQLIVYGLAAAGTVQQESIILAGTTVVAGLLTFSKVMGARIVGTAVGTITLQLLAAGATVLTVAAGANTMKGLTPCATLYVGNTIVYAISSGASTKSVILIGTSAAGAAQIEKVVLTGVVSKPGVSTWSEITYIALGEVEAAQTITFSAVALQTTTLQNTMQKVADYVNGRNNGTNGFVLTQILGLYTFDPANLDVTLGAGGAVDCYTVSPSYYANLWRIVDWINQNSAFVTAEAATGAKGGAPSNTTAAVYLSGGSEGTTAAEHWQLAFNLLKQIRVNTVVPLTADPAVHAMGDAHCAYMCGIGRSERDQVVGLKNTAMTDLATKTETKTQIVALNSRHTRAVSQAMERYNTAGEREEFDPCYLAAVVAGMQAGSTVGESLTFKYANVLKLRQASSWNPTDDAEEMIQAGLCFLELVDGIGRRVVRNNTTHLATNNSSYVEASVNEAVNFAVYNLRGNLEVAVGRKGFSGTVNGTKGVAIASLGLLKDEEIIVADRSLAVELAVDVMEVSVEMAPVIPVNFVKTTVHLVTTRIAAV
jgi:hypothetical protein